MKSQKLSLNIKEVKKKPNTVMNKKLPCPFCQVEVLRKENGILDEKETMMWFENKFPLLKENTYQTLILETHQCGESFATYEFEYAKRLLLYALEKRTILKKTNQYNQVILIKNHGFFADSSIAHAHMQVVGLKDIHYDEKTFEQHLQGPFAANTPHVQVTVSEIPFSEFYEFNIIWNPKDGSDDFVRWIQSVVRYIQVFKQGAFKDNYNMAFHETSRSMVCKIIPKKANSVLYTGYGLHQSPNDVDEIALDLSQFHQSSLSEPEFSR